MRPTRTPLLIRFLVAALPALLAAPLVAPLAAQDAGASGRFKDPQDGRFDMSVHLSQAHGFLPILSPITEPAVGYGIAGAAAFLHRPAGWNIQEARDAFERGERQRPPSLSVVAGGYTLNDSWFVGGGHLGIWRGDRIRYVGYGGYGSVNLTLAWTTPGAREISFDYNLEGWILGQSLRWRLADTKWFLGATWGLAGVTATLDLPNVPEGLGPFGKSSRNGSLGGVLSYDSRDNIFSPSRGISASLDVKRYDDAFLGDHDYWGGDVSTTGFMGLGSRAVLGLKGKASKVGDGAPFWALPSVGMRGVPAQRFLGSSEAQAEAELRWDFTRRWSLVGFGGVGWIQNTVRDEDTSRTVGAGGAGFRYLLARAFGLRGGLDVAYGSEGAAVYITMGSAWR